MIADCSNADCGLFARRSRGASRFRNPQSAIRIGIFRLGISLMEVLISMFVMLFGLMGVAAIFPVGNYYVVEGEKHDQGSLLAANAFEELQARGMLRPELWLYAGGSVSGLTATGGNEILQADGTFNMPMALSTDPGSGHAWVIDPMSSAAATSPIHLDTWPALFDASGAPVQRVNPTAWFPGLDGQRWPVRRVTLPIPDPNNPGVSQPMTPSVADVIFRLRDDLAVEMPERDDAPSMQRWSTADIDNNGNANNTPDDPTDDKLLSRQYHGNFSWLATIVPSTEEALLGLQPAVRQSYPYEVSVAVFYKRVPTPSAETERLLRAEMLPGGELVMYGGSIDEVDKGLEGIKSSAWVAVMGVNQTTGAFMLKWYRLLALDEETENETAHSYDIKSETGTFYLRRAMLLGPDWHFPIGVTEIQNLRVAILPGISSVVTREMVLEKDSLWSVN